MKASFPKTSAVFSFFRFSLSSQQEHTCMLIISPPFYLFGRAFFLPIGSNPQPIILRCNVRDFCIGCILKRTVSVVRVCRIELLPVALYNGATLLHGSLARRGRTTFHVIFVALCAMVVAWETVRLELHLTDWCLKGGYAEKGPENT